LRTHSIALLAALGLSSPALVFAQNPYGGQTTAPPNQAQNSFYNGGAPRATLQQRPFQFEDDRQAAPAENPVVAGELFEPGEVLAIVGDQYVLACDVLPHVNQILEQYRGKVPDEQLEQQRRILVAQLTGTHVEVKLLYLGFLRKAPAEKVKDILKRVDADFDKKLEETRREIEKKTKDDYPDLLRKEAQVGRLALLMKEEGIWAPGELDLMLRRYGGSLAQEKRYFQEFTLGRAMVYQSMNTNPPVSYDEMLKYYQEHQQQYDFPTRVRFEIMSTRFSRFPDKQQAMEAICQMGNEVYHGANFGAVAKRRSQGLNAEQGGYHDWTAQGSLTSKPIDALLFDLEPGKLSQIIEDEKGYHIVRVIERQEAGRVPFEEVQVTLREKVKQQKIGKQYKEAAVKSKAGVTVWTAFDDDPLLAKAAGRAKVQR
jgi:parvulin-like peptidyl-prolyl isomerase